MEIRVDAHQHRRHAVRKGIKLHAAHYNDGHETDEEHQTAHEAEEMHRLFAKLIEEPYRHEVQITVHETVNTELGSTELAFTVLHHFLADLRESGVLGEVRDITVKSLSFMARTMFERTLFAAMCP